LVLGHYICRDDNTKTFIENQKPLPTKKRGGGMGKKVKKLGDEK